MTVKRHPAPPLGPVPDRAAPERAAPERAALVRPAPVGLWGAPTLGDERGRGPGSARRTPSDVAEPWLLSSSRYESAVDRVWEWEEHGDHELLWSGAGTVTLEAAGVLWVVPPAIGVWLPAGVPHRVRAESGAVTFASYVQPQRAAALGLALGDAVAGVTMSALLRELLLANHRDEMPEATRMRMQTLAIDLLHPVATSALDLRLPTSPRLHAVATAILADPADDRTTEVWAASLGMSSRTLTRAFVRECGQSLTQWRILARVRAGLLEIAAGRPVTAVAARLGYANPSTFIDLFRQVTGHTPAGYFRAIAGATPGEGPVSRNGYGSST